METTVMQNKATGLKQFNSYIMNDKTQEYIESVVGHQKESFVANIVSIVSSNTGLQECTPSSVMYSALKATALDLPLDQNLGFAYVLPYNVKVRGKNGAQDQWKKEANFQIGAKGYIQLAQRTGQFAVINTDDVREGELINVDRLTGEYTFDWIAGEERNNVNTIGYVAFFRLTNGFQKTLYMTSEQLEEHGKKYSKTYAKGFGLWKDMKDAMCKKTVLKLLLSKYAPLSVKSQSIQNLSEAIRVDQSVINENEITYIDNDGIDETKVERVEGLFNN